MSALDGTDCRRRIYLLRHGHVDYVRDLPKVGSTRLVPLTEKGAEQAGFTGEALASIPFDRALHSGLPRTKKTAEIVLSHQDGNQTPMVEDPRWEEIEVDNIGQGSPREIVDYMLTTFGQAHEPGARLGPDGEVFAEALKRAQAALFDVLTQPGWKNHLVVAHELINRLLLSWLVGDDLSIADRFEQDMCCVNILDFDIDLDYGPDEPDRLIRRRYVKGINLTPYNWIKHGMHRTSFEEIFADYLK